MTSSVVPGRASAPRGRRGPRLPGARARDTSRPTSPPRSAASAVWSGGQNPPTPPPLLSLSLYHLSPPTVAPPPSPDASSPPPPVGTLRAAALPTEECPPRPPPSSTTAVRDHPRSPPPLVSRAYLVALAPSTSNHLGFRSAAPLLPVAGRRLPCRPVRCARRCRDGGKQCARCGARAACVTVEAVCYVARVPQMAPCENGESSEET